MTVESPPRRGQGDYAVNVAFRLAGPSGMTPYDVARALLARLQEEDGIFAAEIAGGGFLNVTLDDRARAELVAELSGGSCPTPGPASGEPGSGPESAPAAGSGSGPEFFQAPGPDTPATDIERWSAVTGDSPAVLAVRTAQASSLFRVQYAHARACALSRNAHDLGFRGEPHALTRAGTETGTHTEPEPGSAHPRKAAAHAAPRVYGTAGRTLLGLLADHRRVSEQRDATRHARHLVAVGEAFFDFHDQYPPLPSGDEKPGAAHRARLALVEATGAVLAGGLTQLGVSAPAHL